MSSKTQADRLFEAQMTLSTLDAEISTALGKDFPYTDYTYDYYDGSLEIFGLPEGRTLSLDELDRLRDFGFAQVWTHTRPDKGYSKNDLMTRKAEGERSYRLIGHGYSQG